MSASDPRRDEDDVLAAELALGLLDADEQATVAARLNEPGFAARHARWLDHAAELLDGPDAAPPAGAWRRIAERLPANDDAAPAARTLVRRWQAATALASAVAAALLVALIARPPAPPPPPRIVAAPAPPLVAVLTAKTGAATASVRVDPLRGTLGVRPSKLALGSRVPELWLIPADGTPRAIGVVAADARTTAVAPPAVAALLAAGATLAISAEPVGGSPTGKPTGPVVLTGVIAPA